MDLRKIMAENGWKDALLKPCVGGGSRACMRVLGTVHGAVDEGQRFLVAHVGGSRSFPSLGRETAQGVHAPAISGDAATAALPHLHSFHRLPSDSPSSLSLSDLPSASASASGADSSQLARAASGASTSYSSAASGAGTSAASQPRKLNVGSPQSASLTARALADAAGAAVTATGQDTSFSSSSSSFPPLPASSLSEPSLVKTAESVPCDMMVQPYISSVEGEGEISVVIIDGEVSHAVIKKPAEGEYRTQEEHGGKPQALSLTSEEGKRAAEMALRVVSAARSCVETFEPPLTPHSPAHFDSLLPRALPSDAFLLARVDFLRLTKDAHERVFADADAGAGAGAGADARAPSSSSPRPSPSPSPSSSPLLLLELEIIEPCLFFGTDASSAAADRLALAIARRMRA